MQVKRSEGTRPRYAAVYASWHSSVLSTMRRAVRNTRYSVCRMIQRVGGGRSAILARWRDQGSRKSTTSGSPGECASFMPTNSGDHGSAQTTTALGRCFSMRCAASRRAAPLCQR